jgi:hypothetical protein
MAASLSRLQFLLDPVKQLNLSTRHLRELFRLYRLVDYCSTILRISWQIL